jgi:hypothetical protein
MTSRFQKRSPEAVFRKLSLFRWAGFAGKGLGANGKALRRSAGGLPRPSIRLRRRKVWPELARCKRFDRAQPPSEFGRRQTPVAVEAAKKVLCHGFAFLGVAFHAGGNEVAVEIAARPGKRDDVVEAAHAGGEPAQTIEAKATVARMNGGAPRFRSQEIRLLDVDAALLRGHAGDGNFIGRGGANLPGQPDLDDVAGFRALDQAQSPLGHQAPHRQAHGPGRQASAAGKPGNGKAEAELAFEPAMPQEMRIDNAFVDRKAQARHKDIFDLLPDEESVSFADFHGFDPDVAETRFRAFCTPEGRM